MSGSKCKALKRHTKKRAAQRFGINVDIHELADLIQRNCGTFIERQSNRVTVWDVEYKGATLRVVYDKLRGLPITVLNSWMGKQCDSTR